MAKAGYLYYLMESAQLRLTELGFAEMQLSIHERTTRSGRHEYCLVCHFPHRPKWQVTPWLQRREFVKVMEGVEGVTAALYTGSTARQIARAR